jgi:hypothetical protein
MIMQRRPSGVTVLSAMSVVAAILMIIRDSIFALFIPLQKMPEYGIMGMQLQMPWHLGAQFIYGTGVIMFVIGIFSFFVWLFHPNHSVIIVIMFVIGISSFFVAYGLLKGYQWARISTIVFACVGIGIFAIAAALFHVVEVANLVINGIIIFYLFRPNVRAYFGRVPASASMDQSLQ